MVNLKLQSAIYNLTSSYETSGRVRLFIFFKIKFQMQNKSLLKTSAPQKLSQNDIEQSHCLSSISDQGQQLVKTKSQLIVPGKLSEGDQKKTSLHLDSRSHFKPLSRKKGPKGFHLFRKIRKSKKNESDYRKNICGYITKKVMREFVSGNYSQQIRGLCLAYNCDYNEAKCYYSTRVERVTGPSHIPDLLIPSCVSQSNFKKVFVNFFNWFLKERYLRYLLLEGKMTDKKAYINYKNNELIPFIGLKLQESKVKLQQPHHGCSHLIKTYPQHSASPPSKRTMQVHIPIVIRPIIKQQQN